MNALKSCSRTIIQVQKLNSISFIVRRNIRRCIAPTFKEITRRKAKLGPQPAEPRSGYLEWNREAEIWAFNQRLKESFDIDILSRALTHRSHVIQEEMRLKNVGIDTSEMKLEDNRQLIEAGRHLTSKIVEIYLGLTLPKAPEECILALHDHLLSPEVLANSASLIGTKDLILSEEFPPSTETLANTFLALVGALAESVDEIHTSKFVRDFLIATLAERDFNEIWCPENPLEILNGILTRSNKEPAEPRLIGQNGVNSVVPLYRVGLYSNKEFLGEGTESNVEDALKVAALNALNEMFAISYSSKPMKFDVIVDPTTDEIKNLPIHKWCINNVNKLMEKK